MAKDYGKYCSYRPRRNFPRRFGASDCGRIVRYARNAGVSDEEICVAIKSYNPDIECGSDCDCKKIAIGVAIAVGVLELALSVAAKRRIALNEARQAIQRAMETSRRAATRQNVGQIELAESDLAYAENNLAIIHADDLGLSARIKDSIDRLHQMQQDSFATDFGEANPVIIRGE